jgi:hypothetical protein
MKQPKTRGPRPLLAAADDLSTLSGQANETLQHDLDRLRLEMKAVA